MTLYGVAAESELDVIYTYEVESSEEAAKQFGAAPGTVLRVWQLGWYPQGFIVAQDETPRELGHRQKVSK